jgi:hypothetical protein
MAKNHGAMHVATVTSRQVDKAGRQREYQSQLLVGHTYQQGDKISPPKRNGLHAIGVGDKSICVDHG